MTALPPGEHFEPHAGECCGCVPRLREQNHASAAAWTQKTRTWLSELDGLQALMREAVALNRGESGLSPYGQAALAAALKAADDARLEALAWQTQARRVSSELRMVKGQQQQARRLLARKTEQARREEVLGDA